MPRITNPRKDEPIRLVRNEHGQPVSPPRYRAVVDVAQKGSKRQQVTGTFDTIKRARAFVADRRAEVASGTYIPRSSETVEQVCTRWLDSRHDIRPVTVEGYRNNLRPVMHHLGHCKVQTLTIDQIEALTTTLTTTGGMSGRPLGPRSVRGVLIALGQVLDMCMREGTVTRNVARLARRPRVRSLAGTDLPHWQPAELLSFLAHADTDPLAAAWRLTCCGLTRADVLGLRWSDVDMVEGAVRISQGRVALYRSDHVDDPKSAARRRALPVEAMWPGTVDRLRSLSARQAADRLRAGAAYTDSGLVVVDPLGVPVRPEWYSDRFRVLCREAGVTPITLHSVRHSLAFWLHREGVTPADAAALLGHTVEVHLSTYLPHSGAAGIAFAAQALRQSAAAE